MVAAISSQLPRRSYPTNRVLRRGDPQAEGTGVDRDSAVHTEVIVTVPKTAALQRLGRLPASTILALDECLKVSLGLS